MPKISTNKSVPTINHKEITLLQVKNAYEELKKEERNDGIIDEAYNHNFKLVPLPVDFSKGYGKRLMVKGWNTEYNNISKENFKEMMKENLNETKYWNYAMLTGEVSNVLVLDFDIPRQDNKNPNNYGKNWLNIQLKKWNIKEKDIKTPIVETGSGGIHLYLEWEDRFKNLSNSLYCDGVGGQVRQKIEGVDILKNGKNVIYPGSVYVGCLTPDEEEKGKKHKCKNKCLAECEFKGEFYRWKEGKSPNDVKIGKIGEVFPELEKCLLISENKKQKDPVIMNEETIKENESSRGQNKMKECLDLLEERADGYESWLQTCFCILGSGYDKKWVHYFSKKSEKYDEDYTEKNIIEKFDMSKNKYDFASIYYWIKEIHGEDIMNKIIKKYATKEEQKQNLEQKKIRLEEILLKDKNNLTGKELEYLWNIFSNKEKTAYGFMFSVLAKDDIKIFDEKSLSGYIYNPKTALWELHLEQYLSNEVPKYLEYYLNESYASQKGDIYDRIEVINKETDENVGYTKEQQSSIKEGNEEMKQMEKTYKSIRQQMIFNTSSKRDILKEALNGLLQPTDFFDKFNLPANLIPIKNKKILDLKTKTVRDRTKEDLFNYEINVEYKKFDKYPEAEKFLRAICCNDEELMVYMKQLSGYFMTGEICDRGFYIFYGKGKNGKSTYDNIMERILGRKQFHTSLSDDTLLKKKNTGGATPELMDLKHCRLAVLPETDEDAELNAVRIKKLTGGDVITGRPLFMNQISFKPKAKFKLDTNYKPKINHRDRAMLDRIRCVPFNARFEDKDKAENNKFIEELITIHLEQVLSYFVEGAFEWYENGKQFTKIPSICEEALQKYKDENKDTFDLWINDNIKLEENTGEFERRILDKKPSEYIYYKQSEELEADYRSWCKMKDEEPLKTKQIQQLLTQYLGDKKPRRIPITKFVNGDKTTSTQSRNIYLGVYFQREHQTVEQEDAVEDEGSNDDEEI